MRRKWKRSRAAVDTILQGQSPFPALAIDRYWNLVSANAPAQALLKGLPDRLLAMPPNVLRATLDPEGLAPRIENLPEWRHHLLARLRGDFAATADQQLARLQDELSALPIPKTGFRPAQISPVAVMLKLRISNGPLLSLLSTTTVFGTASDITLSELTLEMFFPADRTTREFFINGGWDL